MRTTNRFRPLDNVLLRAERARATGRWPQWRHHDIRPKQRDEFLRSVGAEHLLRNGWLRECFRCSENGFFAVLHRDVATPWGTVRHLMISEPIDRVQPTWAEKQRIKDEVVGRERVAVEVFPPRSALVDEANAYHLWVLPDGMVLPFGLTKEAT